MAPAWLTVVTGLGSGVLSGMFGVGGGIVTTPAIRLFLGGSAISAVATPLPVIIPTAVTGAASYARRGLSDVRAGVTIGLAGSVGAVAGAFATRVIGGSNLLLATAALIAYVSVDMIAHALRHPPEPVEAGTEPVAVYASAPGEPQEASAGGEDAEGVRAPSEDSARRLPRSAKLVTIGAVAGLYSGLLGLGGGFVIVPLLSRWLRMPMKTAIGTSLTAVAILAVPGTLTHAALGHIDWRLALGLTIGVVPGALLGARVTQRASDRSAQIGFAVLLLVAGAVLAANELGVL